MTRIDNRTNDQLRNINIIENFVSCAEGSYLIEVGRTRVLCNASIESKVPRWLEGKGKGWVTAEYSLLPRSTDSRVQRERKSVSGRTQEIQRLIGRSLRAITDLEALGEHSIIIDCDVLEADGGTRTASIVAAFMALAQAIKIIKSEEGIEKQILKKWVTAVSVGILDGTPILDLNYPEDSKAEVDMNVVFADGTDLIEVQGTGEESTFTRAELSLLLDLAEKGCGELMAIQKKYVGELP
ncbi:MAG: ribonuclease PH [Fibrobacterales bacterium]